MKKYLKKAYYLFRRWLWFLINPFLLVYYKRQENLKLHLGCSDVKFKEFTNVDIRYTDAVNFTIDLTEPKGFNNKVSEIYSNAFFEHLYKNDRVKHLKRLYDMLNNDGFVCYTGIPYFPTIAEEYLKKGKGTSGEVFNLYNVYRYTHGDPDRMPSWYLEQLHKSLFDKDELENLLLDSGFKSYSIFIYSHPDDTNPIRVNCGFYCIKKSRSKEDIQKEVINYLKQLNKNTVLIESIKFI